MKTTKKGEWLEIIVPVEWKDITPERLLKEKWQAPKGLLHQWRMSKGVMVNGTHDMRKPMQPGDRLQIHLFIDEDFGVTPEYLPLEVAYEDDHLLIVGKPASMDTHPTDHVKTGTLSQAVAFYLQMNGVYCKIRHIHRLDRDTTGGIVFAKHALAGAMLDRMLQKREIVRSYIAFAEGVFKKKKGEISEPIGRDRHHPTRRRVSQSGEHAVTHYQVTQSYPKQQASLLKLQLQTGRTHQIRVHMSHIEHPLIGDVLYGGRTSLLSRQALHAAKISFQHPILETMLEVDIPWPEDLTRLKGRLESKG